MSVRTVLAALGTVAVLWAAPAAAQQPAAQQPAAQQPAAGSEHPGRAVVMAKCFQCHTDAMFRDARQDRRSWEAAIYRMIGRGGLWTADEIKLMAEYLDSDFGPGK